MIAAEPNVRGSKKLSLRRSIYSVISASPTRAATTYVIESSHKLALAYLIKKMQHGSLQVSLFGLPVEDLALDSIAELFQRSDDGHFTVLRTYFDKYFDLDTANDAETMIALRRLVFSKVNENLFRRYHEADGNLSRIIRNVKDGTKLNDSLAISTIRGQMWVVVNAVVRDDSQKGPEAMNFPLAPPEVLESFFASELSTNKRVRDLTARLVAFTRAHPFYAPGYPLISFARCIRSAFERTEAASDVGEPDRTFSDNETEQAIARAVRRIGEEKKISYVHRGKVDVRTFDAYLAAVHTMLTGHFVHDIETESLCAVLSEHLPGLTENEYKEKHRNILEYLAKLARVELLTYLGANV